MSKKVKKPPLKSPKQEQQTQQPAPLNFEQAFKKLARTPKKKPPD